MILIPIIPGVDGDMAIFGLPKRIGEAEDHS
jgi:hypothetical protein